MYGTWPYSLTHYILTHVYAHAQVNFIRASCRIEQTLNTCVEHLRSRLQVQEEALRLELDLCASFQVKREREANRKIAELGMELEAVKRQLETALDG